MTELGGPTTQAGIFYQNTVAARALVDLLDFSPTPPRERVVEVRLEAPTDVDDLVLRYADGHREFMQVKLALRRSGPVWLSLWGDLATQVRRTEFTANDRLVLVLGESGKLACAIRDLAEIASTSQDRAEWTARLTKEQESVLAAVETAIGRRADALELFRRMTVELSSADDIEQSFKRRRLGTAFGLPETLFSILRDLAAGGAQRRALFLAAPLRSRLANEFGLEVVEPAEWGLPAYRAIVQRLSRIEIPGTRISGSSEELFVWPRTRDLDHSQPSDLEDEAPRSDTQFERSNVDLQRFPSQQVDRYVIVAGPGYGKSTLLNAVASRLTRTPYVPVLIPLGTFAAKEGASVMEFLAEEINRALDLRVDWARLAEQGAVVLLFDGLDEIPSTRRRAVLDRIAILSARYPLVPWLLTVRDPAVLAGPSEARMIELLPLNKSDVERFADALKARIPGLRSLEFSRRLEAYPDMERLVRIPLFLSMLMALAGPELRMPNGRGDLIESYLKTLFDPHEHKTLSAAPVPGSTLRRVAEALAYTRLQAQEIGATEREVLEIVGRVTEGGGDESPEAVLARLQTQGLLRRQSSIRLQFPFPIVQEYLAACHLLREHPQDLPMRVDDAIQRPWAQVIQFALEMHERPTPLIRSMLERNDDAFFTGLRLVARCIVNGAKVDLSLKEDITRRLAAAWTSPSWHLAENIGRLLVDGFSQPLLPEVRSLLGHSELEHHGAGEIAFRANDPILTREILTQRLRGVDQFTYMYPMRNAIDCIATDALRMYAEMIRNPAISDSARDGLCNLVGGLDRTRVDAAFALNLACDESLGDQVRLRAFSIAGASLDERAWPLVHRALRSNDYRERWAALDAMVHAPDPEATFLRFLHDESLSIAVREEIAGRTARLENEEIRLKLLRVGADDNLLPSSLRNLLRLYAAGQGDETSFRQLIEDLASLDLKLASGAIALFGKFPSRELGVQAAHAVSERVSNAHEAVQFAQSAWMGMLYDLEMSSPSSGALHPIPLHPALDVWLDLAEIWMERDDASEVQRLSLATSALRLGSMRAVDRLDSLVCAIEDPDDARYDQEDEGGHRIRGAIDELQRRRRILPLAKIERFARCRRPNVPYAAAAALAAHGNRAALDLLIKLHNELGRGLRSTLFDAVEPIASRLGLVVQKGANGMLQLE